MGLFGKFFGGGSSAGSTGGGRVAKDGTRFRDARNKGDAVIERAERSKPSLGHGKNSPGHRKNAGK